jgi:uncharacterized membrane protein YeaQ/YmgE (transglycosylase-associated protein family)
MGIVSWIVLGLLVGFVARRLAPGRIGGGWVATIILGIIGAFAGGYLGSMFGFGAVTGLNIRSLLLATGGAVVVLIIYGAIRGKK